MADRMHNDPHKKSDDEFQDDAPASELIYETLGLAIAVGGVVCAGVGAIISEVNDGSALRGAIIGGIIGVVLAIAFIMFQTARLRGKGK
ncbi:MAG TPA: hypothetical protein VNZ58_14355 [Thermomicrobiales bacterium]|nr:hypothetical protein [Thermomicrobiales bacterium]